VRNPPSRSRSFHHLARALRAAALRIVSPIDRLALWINGKTQYPPIHLRRQNGPLNAFERTAGEYTAYMVTLAGLAPDSHILDAGCGSGALALMLEERLGPGGRYIGFDVDRPVVEWTARHLADARFSFVHHDYWNATYNPGGERFRPLPAVDEWADIVILKSLLTHLLPEDVTFYLREVRRVLHPAGTALMTAFVFDDADEVVRRRFPFEAGMYRYARESSPESAVAYARAWLLSAVADSGLDGTILPGFWRPQAERPIAYQDILLARLAGSDR
jgi:SAM-dependent methyltransferase